MNKSSSPPLDKNLFICLDCEATGLDPDKDQIIEVALVLFTKEKIIKSFETLIDPECPIPEESTKIHNISDDMVRGAPKIKEVLPKVIEMIEDHIIVGHGVRFDLDLLAKACENHSLPSNLRSTQIIDTLRLARLYGGSPSNSLQELRKHFCIEEEGAHRAMSDVIVNVKVFDYLTKQYATLGQLKKVLSQPIKMKMMPLGKHKGRPLKEVPINYLYWAANKDFDDDLLYSIRSEINRRKKGNDFSQIGNPFQNL